jgi:hypothetical protein
VADTCGVHNDRFNEFASPVEASNSSSNEHVHEPPPGFGGGTSPPQLLDGAVVVVVVLAGVDDIVVVVVVVVVGEGAVVGVVAVVVGVVAVVVGVVAVVVGAGAVVVVGGLVVVGVVCRGGPHPDDASGCAAMLAGQITPTPSTASTNVPIPTQSGRERSLRSVIMSPSWSNAGVRS